MCLQINTTNAFNLEDILNAITPDNVDSQIHHPDHEFARYRRSRIPESMDYLEEEDSKQTNEDEGSGEDDNNNEDNDADKNEDITESGDNDDGSSSGDVVDDDVQNKKSTIANPAEGRNAASVVQQASQQASKPDDFKIPVANGESATKATVGTNETANTNNTGSVVETSNSSSSEVVNPSVVPEVTNTTSGNETTNGTAIVASVNGTDNATSSMNQNTTYASLNKENPIPVSSKVPVVPQNMAETVTPAGINVANAESGKINSGTVENIQALNSNLAVSNTTIWPQDLKSQLVMFSEQEKEKNYTVNPQYNVAYQIPTAKYMGKANDEMQISRNTPAANETVNARQQTAVPIAGTSKRTGIQKNVDELMTAEEIVEDMDSEKEEEEERGAESASGSGSGSGNIEEPLAVMIKATKPGNTVQQVAKEKTASLSANEAAFLSSMEADEDSSGSHLEVTPESGSGSGENVENAVVAEINHMKETSTEKEEIAKKKEESKIQLAAKQQQQQQQQQQSKNGSPITTFNSQVQTKFPQNTAKVQNIPSNTKQTAKTGSYAQNTQHPSQPEAVPQAYKQPQQQATYSQQQKQIYNQQAAQDHPKQEPVKGKTVAQYQTGATATQQYNQNRVNAQKTSDTTESAKIQDAIEKKKDRAEKNKMRAANNGAQSTVQAQIPAQGNAVLSQGSAGNSQGNAPLPQKQPQSLVQATVPSQAGRPVQANKTNQWTQQKPVNTANQGQNIKAGKAAKLTAQNTKSKAALSLNQKTVQPEVTATAKSINKNMTSDAYGEAADLLKTSSKIELKENDDNLPGATGDDITEEDLQKLQSISVNDAAGVNENDFGDLMSSLGGKKEAKKSKQPIATANNTPKAKSWTMVFNGTESEGNLPGSYGDDYLDDGSGDDGSGSGNEHEKNDIEMQIESSIGSSFESTMKSKRGKNKSASGSGSGSGDEYASELLPGDYGSESPLNIDEEGSGDDDDDESGEGLDFMSGNHASGSGKEIDKHIHALLQAHVESPNEQKPVNQPERISISNATRSQGQGAFQPMNYPSVQREYVSKVPDAPRLEQEPTRPEQKSQQLDNDDDDEVSGSGSGETGESSGHSNEGSGSETSFALPFAQPNSPKARPFTTGQKIGQFTGLGGKESSVVQQAVAHVTQNILNNIRQYHGNMTIPATLADSRTIKLENDEKEQKQAEVSDEEEDSGSGSPSSGAIQIKSEDAASGNKKYDSDDNDDDEVEATPEEAETKELKSGKEVEAGQRGQIEKGKEANAHKHEELQPQDEDDEEDPKPKYNGFTVS